jgi:hypothetical protein
MARLDQERNHGVTYFFLFLLLVGASYRIYRFIGRDDITEGMRLRLPDRVRMPLSCSWCLGSWISFLVVGIYWLIYGLPLPILWGLAVACVVGLIGANLDD